MGRVDDDGGGQKKWKRIDESGSVNPHGKSLSLN